MFRSLRGRLIVLLVLLVAAAVRGRLLMVGLFRQSATAQAGQAEAEIGRACDAIGSAYRFYSAGWQGPAAGPNNDALTSRPDRGRADRTSRSAGYRRRDLAGRRGVTRLCLPDLPGIRSQDRCPAGGASSHPGREPGRAGERSAGEQPL